MLFIALFAQSATQCYPGLNVGGLGIREFQKILYRPLNPSIMQFFHVKLAS